MIQFSLLSAPLDPRYKRGFFVAARSARRFRMRTDIMKQAWIAAATFGVIGCIAMAAHANPIAIYNTGSSNSGSTTTGGLSTPGQADAHWTISSTPGSSAPVPTYVVNKQPGVWATSPYSQWIGPRKDESTAGSDPAGTYTYQTTFDLAGLDPTSASLNGRFAVDNCVTEVILNATQLTSIANAGACDSATNLNSFLAFTINSGFVSGINTLTFVMQNASGTSGNPSGLNVIISGTAKALPVPEPDILGVLGVALLGLGGLWIRRRA